MKEFHLLVSHYRLRECSCEAGELLLNGKKRQILRSLNTAVVTQYYVVDFGWEALPKTTQIKLLSRFAVKT